MRGYDLDEYDDYDEYEEEGSGQEDGGDEYEAEEEEPKPTAEELKYLELRQKLKESYRKKLKNGASGSQDKKKLPDNFGSFFGPSKPVIAQRVIEESKPLLEDRHLATRMLSQQNSRKSSSSAPSGSKSAVRPQAPRVSELKRKVEKIKDTRDYSFLFSEDADLPAPAKQPQPQSVSTPRTEARPAKFPSHSRQISGVNSRHVSNSREERRLVSSNGHTPRPAPNKLASSSKPNTIPAANRKQLNSNNGSGPGRPAMPNGLQSRKPIAAAQKPSLPGSKGSLPSVVKQPAAKMQSSTSKHQVDQRRDPREPYRVEQRRDPREPNMGLQRRDPRDLNRGEQRRDPHDLNRGEQRRDPRAPSRGEQRNDPRDANRGKIPSKMPVSSSKPQVQGQMKKPQKYIPSHVNSHDQRPKKRPGRPFSDDEDDGEMAISMIRKMFGYNPNKFAGRDEDDSDMEAGFDDIMMEEKRSARIARKEDEEQLRLIEEEERRERMRKLKKRKMG